MAWRVVKKKKGLGEAFGEAFENVNCRVDLREKIHSAKVSITVFASLEDNPSLPEDKLIKGKGMGKEGKGELIAFAQAAPLGCQKVRDHD
jgi:hypothetical protein